MSKIKFGTDGWRAIIAKEYTVENVARVSLATAKWVKQHFDSPSIVLGYDCRFGGKMFAETVAKVIAHSGIKVILAKEFVSTPMVSLGVVKLKASLGVVITASHNPPDYNGFKLKGYFGGPLQPEKVQEVEDLIPPENTLNLDSLSLDKFQSEGLIEYVDLETMYCRAIKEAFDIELIQNSGINLAYDPMYGAGQNVLKRLLPDTTHIHDDFNPSFKGQAPEPIHKNLLEFSELIKQTGDIDLGIATDGDADRIGLYNGKGKFIDSHHIILLLIHYLKKYKGYDGKVCTAFSATTKVKDICDHYNLELETVKIGFKYIAGIMVNEDVLLGGEESGGIAIKGHIPERDGIWMGLVIAEFMASTGKSLDELIEEVYEITGKFDFHRNDLHLPEKKKQEIIDNCKNGKYNQFGNYSVKRMEDLDGFKYFFSDSSWLMIRPSGTEPVLRTYAEAETLEEAKNILNACKTTIGV